MSYRCPSCGKLVPSWQPVHLSCLFKRLKYIILLILFLIIITVGAILILKPPKSPVVGGAQKSSTVVANSDAKTKTAEAERENLLTKTPKIESGSTPQPTLSATITSEPATITPTKQIPQVVATNTEAVNSNAAGQTNPAAQEWDQQTINPNNGMGIFSDLLIQNDVPFVAFMNDNDDKLMVTRLVSGSWLPQTLDQKKRAGWYPSISASVDGTMYISYWVFEQKMRGIGLVYQQTNSNWVLGPSILGVEKTAPALAFDPQGRAWLAYIDPSSGTLRLATLSGDNWSSHIVDGATPDNGGGPDSGIKVSIAIDRNSGLHIAYPSRNNTLHYIFYQNGKVNHEDVDTSGGLYPTIALSFDRVPWISYYDPTQHNLKLASKKNGKWSYQVIYDEGNAGKFNSLKIDRYGDIHISYYDEDKGALNYAWVSGAQITNKQVDCCGVGTWTSLDLDAENMPHISYYDYRSEHLKYASVMGASAGKNDPSLAAAIKTNVASGGKWVPCSFNFQSQLHKNDYGVVSNKVSTPNNVRSSPSLSASKLGQLMPGERFKILEGPSCADSMVWWRVKSLKSGLEGWTSEGKGGDYWLDPE